GHAGRGGRRMRGPGRASREQHARRAEAALGRARAGEGALEMVGRTVRLQAFRGEKSPPAEPGREHEAAADRLIVEEHGARAAHTLAAAILGSGERAAVAAEV